MIAPIMPGARLRTGVTTLQPEAPWQPDYAAAVVDRLEDGRAAIIEQNQDEDGFELLELEPVEEEVAFAELAREAESLDYPDVELAPGARIDELESPDRLKSPNDDLITEPVEAAGLQPEEERIDSPVKEVGEEFDEQQIITGPSAPAEQIGEIAQVADESAERDYQSAIDPWDDPLPAWDRSQNEWAGTLAQEKASKARRLIIPIAIALILASAAAVYFLVFGQRTATTPNGESKAEQRPLEVPSSAAEQRNAALPTGPPSAVAPSQSAEDNNQTSASPSEGEGRFTLQVASMPNEAAANEMAAELKASGLPAYVVSADLGRRGVWYRIRVGRFATAEEAQRFAASRGLRAEVARD